jgi:UDP-N-acetylmuramoyl-tripeptide--D-alanyl-D-alanine ligase
MGFARDVVLTAGLGAAFAAQLLRWLRVLQREHYEPSSMSRFLGRWSSPPVGSAKSAQRPRATRPITLSHVLVVALVVTVIVRLDVLVVVVSVLYGLFCPVGLSLRGRTGKLQWTRRLSTIAVVSSIAALVVALLGSLTVRPWLLVVAMVWAVPVVLDLVTRALAPYERRQAQRFVDQAVARLQRVKPRVVAITGSFGKTSTKNHLVNLLAGDGGVVASPKSFNNRAGLSRAINENLADGTRVFIAEMGTYGPGEIAELCSWCVPEVAVVTAIGPAHLERMKTLDVIEGAKFEVTERASTVVVNVDDARLARWPEKLAGSGTRVRTAGSTALEASVRVVVEGDHWAIDVDGVALGSMEAVLGVQPTNLACAVAAALELGVAPDQLMGRIAAVTTVANRLNVVTAPSGVVVVDDTFNANPASALAALRVITSLPLAGRRVVVTPGMIELGGDQYPENLSFAKKVAFNGAELIVVGRTNVKSLEAGYEKPVRRFDTRDQAVAWVRSALVPGDGVLYLNDLPDHYP